jgi:hypothetical protein
MAAITIRDTASLVVSDLEDVVKENCDKYSADVEIYETFEIDVFDLEDIDADDVVSLFEGLSPSDQADVLCRLDVRPLEDLEFNPSNLDEKLKFEAFLHLARHLTSAEFIKRLSLVDPIENFRPLLA